MTNEQYIKAIEMRRSRRTYKPRPLDKATMEVVSNMVDIVNETAGLNFKFIEDGTPPFTLFTGKFSLIAVCGPDTEKARIQCGYYGETIVLQCAYHGLGTCWATGTYNENKVYEMIDIPKEIRLYGVIVVGNVKDKLSVKEKAMYNVTHKQSKPYQKMFEVCDEKLPPYYEFAMKMVERAPSATNRRPVHFRYENGVISGYVDEPYSDKSIDFGIAQLHFKLGAAAKGIKGEWDFTGRFCTADEKVIKFPENINEKGEESENE
ncbi:MAG: nitroreductase family protein [Eubacterium sp.]